MKHVASTVATLVGLVLAGCATPTFAPESQPVTGKALQERLAGKTYTARIANGIGWEMRYESQGLMHMTVSNGTADRGRWRTEDNRLCVDFEGKFPSGCSEMRADANRLYLKRGSTGEIVVLTPKP
ncbi:hypothetical protein [Hydrogenophaga sp.]|uniref:hypothetical protein n=1 Tax=Hydrogenophaga sp. TaxID=1904254 RepID=UPI00286E6D7E|nr:hypothetical protein [Hydrogenophaga sp.]